MRLLAAATALVVTILIGASFAVAADFGANDDTAKHLDDRGEAMFARMSALGLRQVVIGVRQTPSRPTAIAERELLDAVVTNADAAGLRVVLALYPYPPREIESGVATPRKFARFVRVVATAFPQVEQFVVGNEPNQPAFWRPQFDPNGANVSAPAFGAFLAAGYDALKAVDPAITVIGVGLSPRGNDKPDARSNISTSPIRFLRSLGAWYRSTGRTRPLMDAFSFHPYPNEATDPLERGYAWPNAGFVNLGRVKQALWDAFHGTAQPTTLDGLRLHLDEVGWQVDTAELDGYDGAENVPVTDEETQALVYADLVRRAACDPDIASVSFFGFRDDGLRTGFQAGLERADGLERPSASAVRDALADVADGCPGGPVRWRPERRVLGPQVAVLRGRNRVTARIAAEEDARGVVCFRRAVRGATRSCREVALTGFRPLRVSARVPGALRRPITVIVELTAEANGTRRSRVVRRALAR